MATLRLCVANLVLRNTGNTSIKNNLWLLKQNHLLAKRRLMSLMCNASQMLCEVKYTQYCRIPYRLEHTTPIVTRVNVEKVDNAELVQPKVIDNVSEVRSVETINTDISKPSTIIDESVLPPIPEPITDALSIIGEPTLKSLGLGNFTPMGIVQQLLEFFHVSYGLPWWAAIAGLTFTLRFFMLPLTIKMKRDITNYQNCMPQLQDLQMRLSEARRSGNYYEIARLSKDMTDFIQNNRIFGFGMFIPYLVQLPVFLSVYFALKQLADTPELKSFQTGGILWFTDLSVPDQYYILPLLTSATIWATIKFGSTAMPLQYSKINLQKFIQLGIPTLVFAFVVRFPSAVLCYWTTTNAFVLVQTFILNRPRIKKYFNIPNTIVHNNAFMTKKKNQGIIEGFKESYENMKLTREIDDRERLNTVLFEKSGKAPVRRTFKFDPTRRPPVKNAVQSKEKQ